METPLQITFRDAPHSDAIDGIVREKVSHLEKYFNNIISCHVVLSMPHRNHAQGNHFHVQINLEVPGEELVVKRESKDDAHDEGYNSINEAFNVMKKQLRTYADRLKERSKRRA